MAKNKANFERKYAPLGPYAVSAIKIAIDQFIDVLSSAFDNEDANNANYGDPTELNSFLNKYSNLLPDDFSAQEAINYLDQNGIKQLSRKLFFIFHPDQHQENKNLYENAFKELMNILPKTTASSLMLLYKTSGVL